MFQNLFQWLSRYRIAALLVAVLLIASAGLLYWNLRLRQPPGKGQEIPLKGDTNTSSSGSSQTSGGGTGQTPGQTAPVSIQLSEGQAQPKAFVPLPVVVGDPLSQGQIGDILTRLPDLPAQPGDQSDFRKANDPLPPPRPGQTIQQSFPPPPEAIGPQPVDNGPLQVLRYSPEGEVPIAPLVSVTFNQPMVALDTVSALMAGQSPVQITPELPGTWRWLGTRTLTFEYDSADIDRLPKATTYTVTIPAGTKSTSGGALASDVQFSFTTPAPKVTSTFPYNYEPQPRDPLFFIHFDQRIDPAAVLATISVNAGGQNQSLRLVDEATIKENPKWAYLIEQAVAGRWLAFKAAELLPADVDVTVTIGPNTPSAEGPLVTTEAYQYNFRTYAPLRIEEHGCSWGDECRPLQPFYIRFNNAIDASLYDPALLKIDPELPGASVNIYGNTINIEGQTKGRTTYTVTISGELQDTFGQKLGQDARLTFKVGSAEPMLTGPNDIFVTVDPATDKPAFQVFTINYTSLDVAIYAVQPTDWTAFKGYMRDYQQNIGTPKVPGRKVFEGAIRVESVTDALNEVNIDLSPYMDGKFGHFVVVVKPPSSLFSNKDEIHWRTVQAWVQVTQIGLDAYNDYGEMVAWANALKDGAPLEGVTVRAEPTGVEATTGPDGTARFAIPSGATVLVAKQGADQALLPYATYYWSDESWSTRGVSDQLRWYVFDDRQMYRPGEEVHLKGWLRQIGGKQDGDVGLANGLNGVSYHLQDATGNDIGSGQAAVSALGGFDFVIKLPDQVNLGYANLYMNASGDLSGVYGSDFYHNIQIQEFRRPEFEVVARNESTGPYFAGESATVAVKASYFAGGSLPNADVTWNVTSTTSSYSPPNWPEFTFGEWTPWWWFGGYMESYKPYGPGFPGGEQKVETFMGKTDAGGEHFLKLDFQGNNGKPLSVVAEGTVMDVNRQAWTGTTTLLVHPATLYIGLRSERYFVEQGQPLKIDFIVTDLDGNAITGRPAEVRAARLEWKYKDGQWSEEEADVQTCNETATTDPVTCTFTTTLGGSYRITATVTDDQGRQNQTTMTRWVSGGKQPPARKVEQEQATLIPDKESYQPGDTAQILVQSPFSPAEGLLTVTRSGIVSTQRFTITGDTTTLSVPIKEGDVPNLNVQVNLNGSAPRTDDQGQPVEGAPARPAFAIGTLNLPIPPTTRSLNLQATPLQSEIEPGGETNIDLVLTDASGAPVADAELAVVVVDEAILALSNYQLADPLSTFYSDRSGDLESRYARASIILANPEALAQRAREEAQFSKAAGGVAQDSAAMEAPAAAPQATMAVSEADGARNAAPNAQQPEIRVRSDFNPLALFAPNVTTDGNGHAQISVKVPDNLTRYRVMVVAVDNSGRRFGKAESNLTARLPLMVRPSAPRFLNFGDRFELPVVLQNQTDQEMTVDVVVRAVNLDLSNNIDGAVGERVTVPARDRIEVRFPAAAQMAGTARLQIAAVSGDFADAATISLPVYTPATTEAFATYGVIDEGAIAQPVASPKDVFPQYGALEISTSSTALQALTDAVLYLTAYPYDCTEQIASRVLAVAALRDVLTAFNAAQMPSPSEMEAAVVRDLDMLSKLQNGDGGFPYWRRGDESVPFNTIHAVHALYKAQSKGYTIPQDTLNRAMEYLRNIESYYPAWYGENTRRVLSAYALYVRDLSGDRDSGKAERLMDEAGLENLPLDAIGWLWPVIDDAAKLEQIRLYVNNHAVETAGAANFTTNYDDQNYLLLGSDRRTDAILLDALMSDNPNHDLIVKVVNGLLAHRTRGHWGNTQENVFVLLSLDRYFKTYENQTPDFVARIWLGETYAGSHEYHGYTTERNETDVPMAYLVDPALGGGETQDVILSKEGAGRLYYRLGLRYAPSDLDLDPLEMGFTVSRVYEGVDDPADVTQDSDGIWHIKAGARVRVKLTMVADNRRYHVALVDPLPAGLEPVNPALAVSGSVPQDQASGQDRYSWWWNWTWYQHQNLRDERAEAFTPLLWEGVYQYDYVTRATTPGRFVVPPAKAEEMYSPEVFGRSGSDVVVVE